MITIHEQGADEFEPEPLPGYLVTLESVARTARIECATYEDARSEAAKLSAETGFGIFDAAGLDPDLHLPPFSRADARAVLALAEGDDLHVPGVGLCYRSGGEIKVSPHATDAERTPNAIDRECYWLDVADLREGLGPDEDDGPDGDPGEAQEWADFDAEC